MKEPFSADVLERILRVADKPEAFLPNGCWKRSDCSRNSPRESKVVAKRYPLSLGVFPTSTRKKHKPTQEPERSRFDMPKYSRVLGSPDGTQPLPQLTAASNNHDLAFTKSPKTTDTEWFVGLDIAGQVIDASNENDEFLEKYNLTFPDKLPKAIQLFWDQIFQDFVEALPK